MEASLVTVTGLTNREFLERHARAGCVGLCGGATRIDTAIRRAQRRLDADGGWSNWSHAFLFQGVRPDGHQWVIESDLQFHRKNIQLGAQENRAEKYFDDEMFPALAVLDFGLDEKQVAAVVRAGLELVARRERYSLRELVGTLLALRRPELRARENLLAKERSAYCSALVRDVFLSAGLDLAPGVTGKNTTPEDIARAPLPHTKYLLNRGLPGSKIAALKSRLKTRVHDRLAKIRR